MSDFRREPIRSRAYLDGAKGSRCTFNIPNVCNYDDTRVVPCHLRDETQGRGIKADDISVADGCDACHDLMDGRSGVLSREDWLFYALRGLQRTIRRRIAQGLLVIPLDAPRTYSVPKPKERKPKEQRKAIQQRPREPRREQRSATRKIVHNRDKVQS